MSEGDLSRRQAPQSDAIEEYWAALAGELKAVGALDSGGALERFRAYLSELVAWSGRVNLTAIRDPAEIIIKHFVDSLGCLRAANFDGAIRVIDVGTGAGFPGLPLRIVRPAMGLTLLDANRKRVIFLKELVEKLGLNNVEVVYGRAEVVAREPQYREGFDRALARAVAPLPTVLEYCLPFLAVGGLFVAQMGPGSSEEIARSGEVLSVLGGAVEREVKLSLPMNMGERSLLVVRKLRECPQRYPRRAGIPEKRPLLSRIDPG